MSCTMQLTHDAYKLKLCHPMPQPEPLGTMVCARGETLSFQIIIHSDVYGIISIDDKPRISPKGLQKHLRVCVTGGFQSQLFLQGLLPDTDHIQTADILLADQAAELLPSIPQGIWCDITIPENTIPQRYELQVALFASTGIADEALLLTQALVLQVQNCIVPTPQAYKLHLDLWQHSANVARYYEVGLWSNAHFALLENVVQSLGALGQKSVTVVASQIPWKGWDCLQFTGTPANLYEHSIIPICKEKDGRFCYDYSILQRYIDLCAKYYIADEIAVFGIMGMWWNDTLTGPPPCSDYHEPILLQYTDKADGCMKYMKNRTDIADYIQALEAYFVKTQQISRVRIVADEPTDIAKYKSSIAALRALAPSFQFKAAINHPTFVAEFGDQIEDFVPNFACTCDNADQLQAYHKTFPDHKLLWYVCCDPPKPNTFLNSSLLESRAIGYFTWLFQFNGFLRWAYTCWPNNPTKDIRYHTWGAGDVNLIYPAKNGGILLSLRWKNLKKSMEEYTMLTQIQEKYGAAAVAQVLAPIFGAAMGTTKEAVDCLLACDHSTFAQVRQRMLQVLS